MANNPRAHNQRPESLDRDLERLRFWQGQKLTSRDFNDQARIDAQLRWWHNRALHDIPGVLDGYTVRLENDTHVVVAKGLAVDGVGRELFLADDVVVMIPDDVTEVGTILLAQAGWGAAAGSGSMQACLPGGMRSASSRVEFFWQPANDPGGYGVVRLGRLYCDAKGELVFNDERRFGSPVAGPRVATGSTISGGTDWDFYSLNPAAPSLANAIGLQVRIDTTAAGFTRTPCYFAWLQSGYSLDTGEPGAELAALLLMEHIDETTIHGFMFRLIVLLGLPGSQNPGAILSVVQKLKPYVCWLGIEPGPPAPSV